jgi:beta-N-acetylhexosaminidase
VRRSVSWIRVPPAVAAIALLAGCSATASASLVLPSPTAGITSPTPGSAPATPATPAPRLTTPGSTPPASPRIPPPRRLASLPKMSAAQLAGQRVIYSYNGLTPPAELLTKIRRGQVAGVIFFSGNISSEAQIAKVCAQLQAAAKAKSNPVRAPLLLMTDQEGGAVRRLPGAPTLSERQVGESAHPASAATAAGTSAGKNLLGVGMNVNLAPVLDVYRAAGNFDDQFGRSYSKDPATVSRLGANFIKAQQKVGVAATSKHFPGLGDATRSQNTDERPVTLNLSRRAIRAVDELPYKQAIAAGTRLVMVSWASYPALGSKRPAGLSSVVVQGELRKRLGYQGVTITDAIEAGGLVKYGSSGNRGVLAASAGMDLILASEQNVTQGVSVSSALRQAYSAGTLGKSAFRASVARIISLRQSLPG